MPVKRTLRFVIAIVALAGFFMTLLATRAASLRPVQNQTAIPQQQIERILRRHETLSLDAAEVSRGVRENGRLLLATPTQSFEIQLIAHDLRAPNYLAEDVMEGGAVRRVEMDMSEPVHTFRGSVRGLPGAEARFTLDDEKVEGVIITANERYYVEPLRNFTVGSSKTDYVLYNASDVIEGAQGFCGTSMDARIKDVIGHVAPKASETFLATGNRQIELATEADFEYVSFFGNAAAANAEILSIMNQVDGLYRAEMGVTFKIVYQHTWSANDDPYSTTVSDGILTEFTNYWNANISQPRDMAHMWTGKQMDSNIAGIAWMGVLCQSPTFSYGVSMRIANAVKSSITAHEIGHNLNASHPDQDAPPVTACVNTVMESVVGQTFDFCQFSRDEMNAYLSANSGCLTTVSAPAAMQFNAANYAVNEGAGSVVITVTRSGDVSAPATVDYDTSKGGTASATSDYIAAGGTLHFAATEANETFTVLVIDDAYQENPETINLSLRNPTGGTLGGQSSATVTISDNDFSLPSGNPIDDPHFFVQQHYYDFLSRYPDQGGWDFWTGQITQCGSDLNCIRKKRVDVSNAYFYELEFQQTGAYAFRLYRTAYGDHQPFPNSDPSSPTEAAKLPSYDVFAADRARVVGGADLATGQQDIANAFVLRNEFLTKYPASQDGPTFVDAVLTTIRNDAGVNLTSQRQALITLFNSGGRGAVMYRLADDNATSNPINNRAFIDEEYNRAFVFTQYAGYLRRDADMGGFGFWLNQVNSAPLRDTTRQRAMVCSFITAAEYQLRFSPNVTRSDADCAP